MEITIHDASKTIRGVQILNHINLQLTGGKVYGLRGPNGSGKTMLIRLIAGLIRPTQGEVRISGRLLGKDMDFPEEMGMLIENPAFLPGYTGFENLKLLARLQNRATDEDIRRALTDVGLAPEDTRKYRKFSLGMKQRLGLAAAIMEQPSLILLDEPTNALDHQGVDMVAQLISRERQRGALIILACHDADFLEHNSDEVLWVSEGNVGRTEPA